MRSQNSFSERIQRSKHSLKRHRKLVTCLAAVVVFAVTYSLVLPAVTLDEQKAEETPGIETQTKVEEQVEKAPAQDKQETQPIEKADAGSQGDASSDSGENAKDQAKSEGSDSSASKDSGSAVKSNNKDSGIKESDKEKSDKDAKESSDEDSKLIEKKTELKFDGNGYKIVAEVDADAKLPADTKLKVKEIKDGDKNENDIEYVYDAYCDEALTAVRSQDGEDGDDLSRKVKLYDIKFVSDSSGKDKVEPAAPVKVTIEYDEAIEKSDKNVIRVVHFDDTDMDKDKAAEAMIDKDKLHEVKKVVLETKSEKNDADSMKDVQFKSDRFSVYGIVYTVAKEQKTADRKVASNVLTARDDNYEITVTYDEKAGIPEGAELKVREITEDDEEYAGLQEDIANNLKDEELTITKDPALFDISIWADGEEIEPVEGSDVNVEIKLSKDSVSGMFTDEDTPLLVNDEPITEEMGDVDSEMQVIHQVEEGKLEVMETQDSISDDEVVSEFTTDSFSDWLLFYDETVDNITIGVNDTLTLRPYSKWVWKSTEEEEEYANYQWKVPQGSSVITFVGKDKYDDQLRESYYYYHGQAERTGTFDLQLTDEGTVVKTIHVTVVDDVADIPPVVQGTSDIKVNLFDYDRNPSDPTKSGVLDNTNNKASSPFPNTVNIGHDLKFLGWGGGNVNGYSINNYSQDVPNQGIVQGRLSGGFPKLNNSNAQSLDYLFNTGSHNSSVWAYPNVSGMFQQDQGYYFFNSNSNYAYLDPNDTSHINLYEHTYSQWTSGSAGANAKPIGFFPFHKYDSYLKEGNTGMNFNTNLNHHFGMSMAVDFEIPSDGLDDYGNPISFEFSGDDDMWVFIDDNLVLDVGGIHQPVTGKIDFSADKVSVFGEADTSITQRFIDAGSPTAWAIGDGRPHTMKVFYLERGGCDSNLSLKFNTPTRFGKGKLSLVKREANKEKPLEGAVFKIWNNAKREGEPIGTFRSKADGTIDFGEFVIKSANDTFYMEEVESPTGYVRDTSIYQVRPRVGGNGDVVKDSNGYIILDVYKTGSEQPLSKLANDSVVFPNNKIGTINIPAKKTWVGTPTEGAQVTLTVKRYKLIDITKGFVIEKKLTGDPEGYTFVSHYVITYPDGHQVSVPYSDFQDGKYGLADAVPGKYIVEEVVTGNGPDGYNMTHSEQTIEVTLQEDGTAKADFNTTFAKKTGKLNISASVTVQNGNASDIDYSKVRYAVLDSEGKKVTSITHEQAVNRAKIDLPVGTYTVKAVGVPKTPTNLKLTEQKVNGTDGTVSGALNIVDGQTTDAAFSTKYTKQNNANNCTWKISDTHINQQYAAGKVEYPVGTKVKMSFQVSQSQVYGGNGNYRASYGGQSIDCTCSNVQGNYEYSVTFTVQENKELVVNVNGIPGQWGKHVDVIGPRFELVDSAKNSILNSFNKSAVPAQKRAAESNALKLSRNNEAKHPDAPEGKKYIKDDEWSSTVTLNSENSWEDNSTLSNLPATDNEGNKYYYYVAAVNETGLEDGTMCEIDLQNGKQLLIGDDLNQNQSLGVTNTRMGALQINKNVTFSGHDPENAEQKKALAGTYSFKIYTDQNCSDDKVIKEGDQEKVITVTIGEDGVAQSSEIVTLPVGTYWVKEIVSDDALVLPVGENPKQVTITEADTVAVPKNVEVTNDCDFNEEDDDITVDIVKKFEGLNGANEIPDGYKAVLSYKLKDGTPQTVDLTGETYQHENGVHVKVTKSSDGLEWTWHVYRIPKDSTGFKVHEENYTNSDYNLSVTVNGEEVQNPENDTALSLNAPTASFTPVAKDRITAEAQLKKYYVGDDYLLLVSVNPHGTVVLSNSSLNYQERMAIRNAVEHGQLQGSFSKPVRFFSTEQHQTVIKLDNKRTITVTQENGRYVVQLPPNTNSQATGYSVKYDNEDAVNNAEIVNTYAEKTAPIEIIKVDKNTMDEQEKKFLEGAQFKITQLDENGTGSYKEKPNSTTTPKELFYQETVSTDDDGKAVSSELKKGYYEIVETDSPDGYIMTTERFYIKVKDGAVTRIKKTDGVVSTWPNESDNSGIIRFTPASGGSNASFIVGNEPGAALPNAGGPGTTWMYILGMLMVVGAGMSLVVRRRMSV